MLVLVFAFFELRIQNAHRLVAEQFVHVTTATAFVRQLVGIVFVQCDVIHIVANLAEFHLAVCETVC